MLRCCPKRVKKQLGERVVPDDKPSPTAQLMQSGSRLCLYGTALKRRRQASRDLKSRVPHLD